MNSNLVTPTTFSYKDLLLRKLYYSVTCSVLSQLIILQLYVFVANFNIFHPVEWVSSALNTFMSISTWLFIFPFITIIFAQTIICAKDYVFKSSYCSTRFQKFVSVFSVHNLILSILHVVIGAALVWLFLSLGRGQYQNLTTNECNKGAGYCLVEGTFFLILGGLWTGLYFFVKVYIAEKHLLFPVVHQRKVLQLKAAVLPMIKDSLSLAIWPALYFTIFYYFWGEQISHKFKEMFSLFSSGDNSDSFLIYLYLWLFSALFYFSMNLMRFYFNLFLTEPVEFPLTRQSSDVLTLQDSLNMSNLPIVQNLACLDLYLLSQWSKVRRQVFFTLSQPGGHPHNWNVLVENVLKLFSEYTELLNKSAEVDTIKNVPAQIVLPPSVKSPFQSPDKFVNLRNMSMNVGAGFVNVVEVAHNPLPGFSMPETLLAKFVQKSQRFLDVIKVALGINFLFGELPQANIQKCLANGQLMVWTCQGISDLACASMAEDRYGIVQKDLPVIITSLTQLKKALDKLNKVPALTRKIVGYNDFNYKMKGAVTLAVRRSLFNICRTFGGYVNDLPLSKDVWQHLQGRS